jgi:hypothetical protein
MLDSFAARQLPRKKTKRQNHCPSRTNRTALELLRRLA